MSGLSFVVRDKHDQFLRRVYGVGEHVADLLWNDTSLATFSLDDDAPGVPELTAVGARCAVMLGEDELFRGRVARSPGVAPNGQIEFHVQSDHRKLKEWLGWQKPTAPFNAQDVEYAVYTGSTEKVVKDALAANLTRLGVPWAIAANQNRGVPARVELRMHKLADKLVPPLTHARLMLTLAYGPGVTVDVREPDTITGLLDTRTGVLDAFSFDRWAPTATRVVRGGRGEGVEREFYVRIDSALESDWNDVIEIFEETRHVEEGSDLSEGIEETLAENAPGVSVSMDLTETNRFRFLQHYNLGDVVEFMIGGQPGSEVISRITITENPQDGVRVTPRIGEVSIDPVARLGAQLAELQKRVRDLGRR